jgi:hypothetical protein
VNELEDVKVDTYSSEDFTTPLAFTLERQVSAD